MSRPKDLYPTRTKDPWRVIARRDPVVHPNLANAGPGPLDTRQLEQFEESGFIRLEGMIPKKDVHALVEEAECLRQASDINDERVITEPTENAVRSVFQIHRSNDVFQALCASPPFAGIARQLLGDDVYIHQSRINYKPGFSGREFYWHSDFETWHSEDGMPRMRAVSCVISLSDNYEVNAPLMIIPNSHKLYITCQGKTPPKHYQRSLKMQEFGTPDEEALTMLVKKFGIQTMTGSAGTVVFFDCNAMHGSSSNITPYNRNNLFFVYNAVSNALVEPYCSRCKRPDFIAERDTTPVEQLMPQGVGAR